MQPVKGRFGMALLQVNKIEPGEEKTYEQIATQIKNEIAESPRQKRNRKPARQDRRRTGGGSTLAEAAKKLGLRPSPSKQSTDPDADRMASRCGLPQTPDVVNAAFSSDVGVDTEALQLPNGGYLYFDVIGMTPSRERTLDEVKEQVAERLAR